MTDVGQRHVAAMGNQLGHRYNALWNEVVWLHAKWQDFKSLYAHSAERIDLLNTVAPHFFWQLQATLWEDILLHIARVTDPPRSAGKHNLTIRGLDQVIPDQALAQSVQQLIDAAVDRCEFARDWRNRRLAHSDLDLKLNQAAQPLASASRRDVQEALDAISHVLERVHYHYFSEEMRFSEPLVVGGADALISYLQRAVQAEDQQREQWRQQLQTEVKFVDTASSATLARTHGRRAMSQFVNAKVWPATVVGLGVWLAVATDPSAKYDHLR